MPTATALLAIAVLFAGAPLALAAQTTAGLQDLRFGVVIPGVNTKVNRTDALRAGQFRITGTRRAEVRVDLALPAVLRAGVLTMPVQFASNDGGWDRDGTIGSQKAFNPNGPLITRLHNSTGRLFIYLGGTAMPTLAQLGGNYAGTIVMTVAYTGN